MKRVILWQTWSWDHCAQSKAKKYLKKQMILEVEIVKEKQKLTLIVWL